MPKLFLSLYKLHELFASGSCYDSNVGDQAEKGTKNYFCFTNLYTYIYIE